MLKVITYSTIEEKNRLEQELHKPLSPHDSLVHCLNVLDFMRALRQKDVINHDEDHIDWITIELRP